MTDLPIEQGRLDIGRVIQQTFQVAGRNFATFFLLSLVLVGLPAAIVRYVQFSNIQPGQIPGMGLDMLWAGLASMITGAILQGALIYGTVQDLDGKRPTLGDSISVGLRAFLPLIGLSILLGIALICGFILLIVPGIMLACAWCVAVPALVAERRRIMEAFGRSAELTRGNRWRIFGLFLIFWVAAMVIGMVIGLVTGFSTMMAGDMSAQASPLNLVVNALLSALYGLVVSTGAAVLYLELRQLREGRGAGALADIFA